MCGLAGFLQAPGAGAADMTGVATHMARTLTHRGPDDEGTWVDPSAGVALGFRRLSILDLSPLGHQPMLSRDSRFAVVFNGEIYNYRDLRRELEPLGWAFRGTSDTEVMLAAFCTWGIQPALKRLLGMFAMAVWDADARTLTLARDRLGKKPLYYGLQNGAWLFGSELKALRAHPAFRGEIDRDALSDYFRYSYVPSPRSIYRGISKVRPAHAVVLRTSGEPIVTCYWDAPAIAYAGQQAPVALSDDEAVGELEALLRDAVARRMVADVPVGAFLSGGLDSTTVVAMMQAESTRPVRTFTIGFEQADYNEAESAHLVAAHLRTDHTELYVTPAEARSVIPRLPAIYDEPFADSSQIPTLLVSELARRDVTVALSGDGGDELFGGYNRYSWGTAIWRRSRRLPAALRRVASRAVRAIPPERWSSGFARVQSAVGGGWRLRQAGDKMHKAAAVFDAPDRMELYSRLVSAWHRPETLVVGTDNPGTSPPDAFDDFALSMMLQDLVTYLPDDILVKVDRASMAVSLEARAPLLDHRVVEWAWRLPLAQRIRGGSTKWLLRQLAYRHVPQALIDRPKAGFGIPLDAWLRGPLREWADDLLSPARLVRDGVLHPEPITAVWSEHLSGHRNHHARLWPVLMFQAWRDEWLS